MAAAVVVAGEEVWRVGRVWGGVGWTLLGRVGCRNEM